MKQNFRRLVPYLNRMKNPVVNVGNLDTTLFKTKEHFQNATEGSADVDVLLVNKFPKNFDDMYATLKNGGMCVFFHYNMDAVMNAIQQWRLDKKHCPEIHGIVDDHIWFWWKPIKKDETMLNVFTPAQPAEKRKSYDDIVPPTPGSCHLTVEMIEKYLPEGCDTFIETGTYFGHGIEVAHKSGKFNHIFSIELDEDLAERAQKMYQVDSDVAVVIQGDSAKVIEDILVSFPQDEKVPVLFWLDAHASGPLPGGDSGGTPVLEELRAIKAWGDPNSTIIIDDCRLFGSAEWSRVEKQSAIDLLREINPKYKIVYEDGEIERDVLIAYVPKG